MRSIARTKRSGLKVVSTFTGCGGSCLGFKMAGFEVLWASEFVKAARDTYRANFPGVHIDERDIRQVTPESIMEQTGLKAGELDVLAAITPTPLLPRRGSYQPPSRRSPPRSRTRDVHSVSGYPTEKRKFTIGELKRVCSFPDDFTPRDVYGVVAHRAY